jgi:transcriptional regulator with XRE-family HTH domain
MSTTIRERLIKSLPKNEELAYAYDEQFLNTYISTQIRVLRESRGLTQAQLAKLAKTGQSQISEMEGDYESWSLRTLRKLARAFGVRLFVSFESWGELIPRVEEFQRDKLVRPTIDEDPTFRPDVETVPSSTRIEMSAVFRFRKTSPQRLAPRRSDWLPVTNVPRLSGSSITATDSPSLLLKNGVSGNA